MKDFDITQINADTKIVVFRVPFSDYVDGRMELIEAHLKPISDSLMEVGVKALFIDDSIEVEPLADDLLKCGNLKGF